MSTQRVDSTNYVEQTPCVLTALVRVKAECLEPGALSAPTYLLPRPEFQRTLAQLVRASPDRNQLGNVVKQMVVSCSRVAPTGRMFLFEAWRNCSLTLAGIRQRPALNS